MPRDVVDLQPWCGLAVTSHCPGLSRKFLHVQGAAVARQRAVWERALELRILLQRCLAASHQLPRPEVGAVPWPACMPC